LPRLKAALNPNWLVAAGTFGTAGAMALFGLAHEVFLGLAVSLIAGVSWIAVLSSLNISAQVALPDWVPPVSAPRDSEMDQNGKLGTTPTASMPVAVTNTPPRSRPWSGKALVSAPE
jgi:hypothetical protein